MIKLTELLKETALEEKENLDESWLGDIWNWGKKMFKGAFSKLGQWFDKGMKIINKSPKNKEIFDVLVDEAKGDFSIDFQKILNKVKKSTAWKGYEAALINELSDLNYSKKELNEVEKGEVEEEVLIKLKNVIDKNPEIAEKLIADFSEEYGEVYADALLKACEQALSLTLEPSKTQMLKIFIKSSIPFIGFGFMDNAVMLMSGDAIEENLGTTLHVGTYTALGIGNLLSDIGGIKAGELLEKGISKLGFDEDDLTPHQHQLKSVLKMKKRGEYFGLALGCIIGMFPIVLRKVGLMEREKNE